MKIFVMSKFFLPHKVADESVDKIKKRLRRVQNGAVSRSMGQLSPQEGMQNYGVSLLHIKEVAEGWDKDNHLAVRLWASPVRDDRLAAIYLVNVDQLLIEELDKWVSEIESVQEEELFAQRVISKHKDARKWILDSRNIANTPSLWHLTLAHLALSNKDAIIDHAEEVSDLIKAYQPEEGNTYAQVVRSRCMERLLSIPQFEQIVNSL